MAAIPDLYNAQHYRAVLPTFPQHYVYSQLGLPLALYYELMSALYSPISSSEGRIGTLAQTQVVKNVREVECLHIAPSTYTKIAEAFTASVSALTQQYFGLAATPCSAFGIFKYNSPTGHYTTHCDAGRIITENGVEKVHLDYPCRNISFVYYPHEDFTGGEFELSPVGDSPIRIKPRADHFILFPSDVRYPHKVFPTLTKSRIAIVNWFSLQGQTDATAHDFVGVPTPVV